MYFLKIRNNYQKDWNKKWKEQNWSGLFNIFFSTNHHQIDNFKTTLESQIFVQWPGSQNPSSDLTNWSKLSYFGLGFFWPVLLVARLWPLRSDLLLTRLGCLSISNCNPQLAAFRSKISYWLIPVVDGDKLEEILALPLAGHVDHQGPCTHAVRGQAWHEGLQQLELSWSWQHCNLWNLSIKCQYWNILLKKIRNVVISWKLPGKMATVHFLLTDFLFWRG